MSRYWLSSSACAGWVETDEQDVIVSTMVMWEFMVGKPITTLLRWLKSMYNEDFKVEPLEKT